MTSSGDTNSAGLGFGLIFCCRRSVQAKSLKLSPALEYVSALAYLTTFGILGVSMPTLLFVTGLILTFFEVFHSERSANMYILGAQMDELVFLHI